MKPFSKKATYIYGFFICLWFAFFILILRDHIRHPYVEALLAEQIAAEQLYGNNRKHDFSIVIRFMLAEIIVLFAILRPRSYRRSYARAMWALGLGLAWTIITVTFLIHSGGIMYLHHFWLFAVNAALVIMSFVSGYGHFKDKKQQLKP